MGIIETIAKEIKRAHIGISGKARLFFSSTLYNWFFQHGVFGGSKYGIIDSCSNEWVTDHYEMYMKTTRSSSSSSYPSYDEIKLTSEESLVGKTISIVYTFTSSGAGKGTIQIFNDLNSYIGGISFYESTEKKTVSYTINNTNTTWVCITNYITGLSTSEATLSIYSIKVDDKEIL